jgi:2-polyprenyl-3-methyl-5-hydroxy-6-metoxy-1,4-benzoquinol methylase
MSGGAPAGRYRAALRAETPCALCGPHAFQIVSTRDRRGAPLRTVMCERCGLVWTSPRPSEADVDRYYARDYRADYASSRVPTARTILRGLQGAEERWRALGWLLTPGTRVLDVGCGAGEFVYVLRRRGLDACGLEPGEEYAEFSRRVLGIPVQIGSVQSAAVEPGSQQVVTMFHMLEHVADPRRVLSTIRGWLSPQGTLVVEVPNVESIVQAPRHRFHYAHLYSFSASTLGALGEAAGLRVVRSYASGDGGNVTCVFEPGTAGPPVACGMPDNVARMREIFRTHTSLRHYATAVPYRRFLARLRGRWREDRLLRRHGTVEQLLLHLAGAAESRLD